MNPRADSQSVPSRHGRCFIGRADATVATTVALLAVVLCWCFAAPAAQAQSDSPDEITIAFYAPSIYFSDSVARAGFINSVATQVETAIGVTVRGINISSASDLSDVDFAIVDGLYFAGAERGDPIGAARGDDGSAAPLAVIVSSSGPSRLADLRGSTLILPRVGDRLRDFITSEVLHNEISADEFFGEIEYTSNIESALSAVSQGRAEATVGFATDGDRSGLSVLGRYDDAPLPVVSQMNGDLPEAFAEQVANAIRGASGSGSIDGFGRYDSDEISSFRRRSVASRPGRTPVMTRARGVTMSAGDIDLPSTNEALVVGSPVDLVELPAMDEP